MSLPRASGSVYLAKGLDPRGKIRHAILFGTRGGHEDSEAIRKRFDEPKLLNRSCLTPCLLF
jgi:hypothetical protein